MSNVMLGAMPDLDAQRDAIHIAVAPVVAAHWLLPGVHVGLIDDKELGRCASSVYGIDKIGIVDPYVTRPIMRGQRFWLCLYPQTITSLRHDWSHPSFSIGATPSGLMSTTPDDAVTESRSWIVAFAGELDQTYNRLMAAAEKWVRDDGWTYDNSETYKQVGDSKWQLFWAHYEVVTGTKVVDHDARFFTCSC